MSIWSSLFTSSSGLDAYGKAIGVVGNNIANVSTIGFKESRAGFGALLGGLGANQQRIGAGVAMNSSATLFGQGSLQQTGRTMDTGIAGRGFFVTRGSYEGLDGTFFSRDGRFGFDSEGFLVNGGGLRLQAYGIDPQSGAMDPNFSDLQIPEQGSALATSAGEMVVRLSATAATAPDPGSTYSSSMTVYDSLGVAHEVTVELEHQGSGNWTWNANVDGADITGGTPGTPTNIGSGTLTFDTSGQLIAQSGQIVADFNNADPGQLITMDFTGSEWTGQENTVVSTQQDGAPPGGRADVTISEDGTVTVHYDNGARQDVARLAVALFGSEAGLNPVGSQLFQETNESGTAAIAAAGDGARGTVVSGSLEGSNVDIGSQLVTLIQYQRAFQANARAITTADEMLAETANIKR